MTRRQTRPGQTNSVLVATPEAFAERFGVSRETLEKLETYEALLRKWQKTINLVAPSTLDAVWHRHFADSAQLVPLALDALAPRREPTGLAPASAARSGPLRWVDLGSGAGFPGLVVAIMLAGEPSTPAHVTLIESDQRKAAFLREVARVTGTHVDILSIRIEHAATQFKVTRADVVSARALAPLPKLLGLAAPFLAPASVALFPKGRDVEAEVAEAQREWVFDGTLVPSLTDEDARIAVIRHLGARREVEP